MPATVQPLERQRQVATNQPTPVVVTSQLEAVALFFPAPAVDHRFGHV